MAFTFEYTTLPEDPKAAIRQMKRELRAHIGDVQAVWNQLNEHIAGRIAELNARKAHGETIWPEIPFHQVVQGTVTAAQRADIKKHGCAVKKAISNAIGRWHGMLHYSTIWIATISINSIAVWAIAFWFTQRLASRNLSHLLVSGTDGSTSK